MFKGTSYTLLAYAKKQNLIIKIAQELNNTFQVERQKADYLTWPVANLACSMETNN